ARGVHIGANVWIGYDVILETSRPDLITFEDGDWIRIGDVTRVHMCAFPIFKIERDAFIGPGVIILPNVVIGRGAVVTAGSVVTHSVAPMTLVQGNPAASVARCGVSLTRKVKSKEFSRRLRPLPVPSSAVAKDSVL